jgi:uncharacterized protein YuzE
MRIEYDAEADALYILLRDCESGHTVDVDDAHGVSIRVDDSGRPVGIEILWASELLGADLDTLEIETDHPLPRLLSETDVVHPDTRQPLHVIRVQLRKPGKTVKKTPA